MQGKRAGRWACVVLLSLFGEASSAAEVEDPWAAFPDATLRLTLFCVWKDALLKLDLSEADQSLRLTTTLGNVPTPGEHKATFARKDRSTWVRFTDLATHYVHTFEVHVFQFERAKPSDAETHSERGADFTIWPTQLLETTLNLDTQEVTRSAGRCFEESDVARLLKTSAP